MRKLATVISPARMVAFVMALLPFVGAAATASAAAVPQLTGRVVDEASILAPETRRQIEAQLKAHEDRTTNQVVVLTVPSLEGDSIEAFAEKVFARWKLGQEAKDNGVLVVVSTGDRKVRIEVGYGLEASLTDGMAGSIIRNTMVPRFKANDFAGGIESGVTAIIEAIQDDASGTPGEPRGTIARFTIPKLPRYQWSVIGAVVFGILGWLTVKGVTTPRTGWFLYPLLFPLWLISAMIIVHPFAGIASGAAYLIGFPLAKLIVRRKPWYQQAAYEAAMAKKQWKFVKPAAVAAGGGSDFDGGGDSSSSSGGGSSGGGGGGDFSGGGGDSGGGGASGSW